MDSFTLLHHAMDVVSDEEELSVLSFNYGQRHDVELEMTEHVCSEYGLEHQIVNIEFLQHIANTSALTGGQPVPEGHYTDESMKKTVVPNRNMILTSIAIAHAVNIEFDEVWLAQHSGDHAIYPDCRPAFVDLMDRSAQIANWHSVRVRAPFISMDKTKILRVGATLGLTAESYAKTWTCYQPQQAVTNPPQNSFALVMACGRCGSCTERLEAFAAVGWKDPLPYVGVDS